MSELLESLFTLLTVYTRRDIMLPCSTNAFRPGDVVQIQVSFLAFQVRPDEGREKTFSVRTILRSVALIDTSVRIVSDAHIS